MEYDSRPKIELFVIADPEEETKELFFTGRKAMAIIGAVSGLIVAAALLFFTQKPLIAISFGLLVGVPMGVLPVMIDKSREAYFTPLLETIVTKLQGFDIEVGKQEIMDLLSFKEVRINNEHVLLAHTADEKLTIYVATDILPDKVKKKKEKTFPVKVLGSSESDVKPKNKPSKHASVSSTHIQEEEPGEDAAQEAKAIEVTDDVEAPDTKEAEVTEDPIPEVSEEPELPQVQVSTHAIDIVPPRPESDKQTIGEIAPGVTGPIPVTVGDRSLKGMVDDSPAETPEPRKRGRRSSQL